MLTSSSLLLSSSNNSRQENKYYPPSPPLSSSIRSPPPSMSKSTVWCPPTNNSIKSSIAESSSFLNLEHVVQTYGSQPELLELILSSKVEEDRRRAEEAKLRRKEIDYMLQESNQQEKEKKYQPSLPPISTKYYQHDNSRMNSFSSTGSNDSTLPRLQQQQSYRRDSLNNSTWRNSVINKPPSPKMKNSSNIEMLLIPSPKSLELKLPQISTMNHNVFNNNKRSSFTLQDDSQDEEEEEDMAAGSAPPSPPSTTTTSSSKPSSVHKRRRREMQAITTIIETREFPYNDDYLWKNNGNTVHKKTGFKSIYYKCSNSSRSCPVNKTVTFKDNGEHLIKYRGQHLPLCNRIKRILDL